MPSRNGPSASHRPPLEKWPLRSYNAGDQFVRIYDRRKARDPVTGKVLYKPVDFNPTLVKDRPEVRGRFSARDSKDPAEWYSYLYLGENRVDERTALLECIDTLSLGRTADGCARLLDVSTVGHLSFAYARLRRSVTLVDLTTEPSANVFKAQLSVIQGSNHRVTRQWARYLRGLAPELDGICYTPKRYGSAEDGANLVFFAPHRRNGDMLEEDCAEVEFDSGRGIMRLLYLSRFTGIHPNI